MKKLLQFWYLRLLFWLVRRAPSTSGSISICANRYTVASRIGPHEVTTEFKDTRKPDGYERTELLRMLQKIRKHEAIQGWKVPDF